jgi:hypothetical protein
MNSLCQFWNDSNQNCEVLRYSSGVTPGRPCRNCSSLYAAAPETAWVTKAAMKSTAKRMSIEFS